MTALRPGVRTVGAVTGAALTSPLAWAVRDGLITEEYAANPVTVTAEHQGRVTTWLLSTVVVDGGQLSVHAHRLTKVSLSTTWPAIDCALIPHGLLPHPVDADLAELALADRLREDVGPDELRRVLASSVAVTVRDAAAMPHLAAHLDAQAEQLRHLLAVYTEPDPVVRAAALAIWQTGAPVGPEQLLAARMATA